MPAANHQSPAGSQDSDSSGHRRRNRALQAAVHAGILAAFGGVWAWHLTEQANKQEVAHKTGWFFNYLTFFSFTLQLLQFAVCLVADIKRKGRLVRAADDLACITFSLSLFVSLMYYYLLFTGGIVDSDDVPSWVSPVLHTGNTLGAVLDFAICLGQRRFTRRAELLSAGAVGVYVAWLYASRQVNGEYPYAFMNDLPEPWGFPGVCAALLAINEALFLAGRWLATGRLLRPLLPLRGRKKSL